MRLAFLTNNRFPPREGIATHILEVARRLQARGHRVTVLARGDAFADWREERIAGVLVRSFPHYPLRPFHQALMRHELAGWLRDGAGGAELLHVHLPLLPPLPTELPIVATFHSPLRSDTGAIPEPGLRPLLIKANARLFSRRYEQWYLDHAAAVVAVSEGVRCQLAAGYRLRGQVPVAVPNGVDADFFAFAPLAGRERRLVYVGRLGYRKGLSRLLDAFAQIPWRLGLELVLVGEGPLEPALRRRAAAWGIEDRVHFLGFLDRDGVRRELQRAICCINPADYETGPLTLLEAMACGTPVVTTPTGLAAEMGESPPFLLVPREPVALAGAVVATVARPEATALRAMAARALVVGRYGWERVVDRLEAIYGARERLAA